MLRSTIIPVVAHAVAAVIIMLAGPSAADVFTYQGELRDAGAPVTDLCDFRFSLFDAAGGGNQIGSTIELLSQPVIEGRITADLDFGAGAFDGGDRWVEIEVRCPAGSGSYVPLSPRQQVRPTPYAMYAMTVGSVPGSALTGAYGNELQFSNAGNTFAGDGADITGLDASNISSGILGGNRLSGTYSRALNLSNASNTFNGSFSGDGAGLTLLNASNISSGTLADARLSANIPRLNAINSFTATNIFNDKVGVGTSPAAQLDVVSDSVPAIHGSSTTTTVSAVGVRGTASSSIGGAMGGDFQSTSENGFGVRGRSTAATGFNYGVLGEVQAEGIGVYGNAPATTGETYAGYFATRSSTGIGVQGIASSSSGDNYGVRGRTLSSTGYAGFFEGGRNYFQGFVGIGTQNPTSRLHLVAPLSEDEVALNMKVGSSWTAQLVQTPSSQMQLRNGGQTRLVVNSGGRVGIGTTSPAARLHAAGGGVFDGNLRVGGTDDPLTIDATSISTPLDLNISSGLTASLGSNTLLELSGPLVRVNGSAMSADGNSVGINTTGGGAGFALLCNGSAAKPGGGSWTAISDARLKKNIHDLDGSLDRLLCLRGVTFEYRDVDMPAFTSGVQIGMIAQEVESVFPEWVDEIDTGYKAVTFRGFEALTVEALRELRAEKDAEITALRARNEAALREIRAEKDAEIAALRDRLARLEAMLTESSASR